MEAHSNPSQRVSRACGVAVCLALSLAACGGGSSGSSQQQDPGDPGEAIIDPATGRYFLVDSSSQGESQTPRILRSAWGRLVRVFGLETDDVNGALVEMQRNFLISPGLTSGQGFLLRTNAVTGEETLTILENVNSVSGLNAFFDKLRTSEQNLAPIFDVGTGGAGLFTMIPRNAAIMVQFDDLIDASTLDPATVKLHVGVPPIQPFEARILIDANHGDLADYHGNDDPEFYTTRVILDPAVTQLEAFDADPPLPINGLGLPPSLDVLTSNLQVRIPTRTVQGVQDRVLMNPSGHALSTSSNGTIDFGSPTQDVVRAARSGGPSDQTSDPFNGFLPDQTPPRITGSQLVDIVGDPVYAGGIEFTIPTVTFRSMFCSQTPVIGDVIAQTQIGVFAEVIAQPLPVAGGDVNNVDVRLLVWPSAWGAEPEEWVAAAPGSALFLSAYDPNAGDPAACFVQISPQPSGYPEDPTLGVFTSANFSLRFSEPMDPRSLTAFDALQLLRQDAPSLSDHYVSGTVQANQSLQTVTFFPDLPLAHATGQSENYYLEVTNGALGATDLAGNQLSQVLTEDRPGGTFTNVELGLLSTTAPQPTGGRVSRFTSADEDPPFGDQEMGPLVEFGGQHTYDLTGQALRPRPVTRMQAIVDRSQPMITIMTTSLTGQQSPVSNLGSKTQMLWRYVDAGFSLTDPVDFNLDIEGLNWAPYGGEVVVDNYSEFQVRLSHAAFLPDEIINPLTMLPVYPNSGLQMIFANNFLNEAEDPQRIVHPKELGYEIHPGNIFVVGSNVQMLPFPLNRSIPMEQFRYYTWRDTKLQTRGGLNGYGGPPAQFFFVFGIPFPITGDCILMPTPNPYYSAQQIQSVGLPLLMEFRCYPEDGANGLNRFDTSLAVAQSNRPFFRAFSEGGLDTNQDVVQIDPDLEAEANGGYNPGSVPVPGAPTTGLDGNVYIGGMDLVVRISRSFSLWMEATNPLGTPPAFLSPNYFPATVEPRAADQPSGTSIALAFRGATLINPATSEVRADARQMDPYGDHYTEDPSPCDGSITHNSDTLNLEISFQNNDMRWFDGIDSIDGAQYYQVRLTFTSNTVSGESPALKALAMNWAQ